MAAAAAAAMSRRLTKKWRSASHVSSAVFLFLLALLLGAIVSARWITVTSTMLSTTTTVTAAAAAAANPIKPESVTAATAATVKPIKFKSEPELDSQPELFESKSESESEPESEPKGEPNPTRPIPLSCSRANETSTFQSCPSPPLEITNVPSTSPPAQPRQQCPSYFRWIHEDLRPWRARGITRRAVESARRTANFRLVVLRGRAYVERYRPAFQTRDAFTLWGVLQLLRRYPGLVPDLDVMFDCVDWPVVKADHYRNKAAAIPPPLFRYCGNESTLDIVFPDWSFWGWPEINIKPWEELRKEIEEGNKQVKWMDREPYAYWKGNPAVAETRQQLMKCNVSDSYDWNARIYAQDWLKETHGGFKESNLASQCIHRYKIYIEGSAWSVSQKYIMACDSLTLLVKPNYYDFFTRGLMPVQHYWPIREEDKCRSIKFAVDWGNSHKQKVQSIGKEASDFVQENLKMDYVYDYMLHLLTEYSKLLRYKPTKPPLAVELCAESMACSAEGLDRKFMMDSMVSSIRDTGPCDLPPPFKPAELKMLQRRKDDRIKQVEMWEQRAWENRPKKKL
ncbi:O-glucosyltransferase rumi homolog isoform X1 [Ananas comosus]|uniref:O-glucosyltransferase rumi homolog isoform X1 n=2 Tax=Ananas comosus TaxID=4615 RepID=A0A6P5EE73_ANACO|nr:O-glucosyltransferase rumi homolog isoform X1 [Ananas comosus]